MPGTRRPTAAQRERHAAANAALVRRVVEEACDQGNLSLLEVLLPPDAAEGAGEEGQRPAGEAIPAATPGCGHLRGQLAAFRAAVPSACWTILEQVAEGETVVTRLSVRGSFSGPLLGLASPGRIATLTGVVIVRFAEGRPVALWLQADLLGLLQQLGVMPALDLAQAVTVAQVLHAGAMLADVRSPSPPRAPPHRPAAATAGPE